MLLDGAENNLSAGSEFDYLNMLQLGGGSDTSQNKLQSNSQSEILVNKSGADGGKN